MEQQDPTRADYPVFRAITTRWMDNDLYGHVNNVVYYSYFDTAVNAYLIEAGGLDIHLGEVVGFVVDSRCTYRQPVAFPETLETGLRVDRLGTSSVSYGVGIFRTGETNPSAFGQFVHVFVNRETNRSTPIPAPIREALERLR